MILAGNIFEFAMALLDELGDEGSAYNERTGDYELRTPAILNSLLAEERTLLGKDEYFEPVESMESELDGIDESYALGPMQYGLAAALVADENPALAAFLESRYEELRDRYAITYCSRMEDIENWYGGLEYGQFGRW